MQTIIAPTAENTTENSIALEPYTMGYAHEDLELYIQLLRNELNEDFDTNARTQKLTDKQKTLLPLYAQMITAHSTCTLQDLHEELTGYAEKLAVQRG